ncbi:MAG: hypothetical protein DME08_18475 [Candidatus Rokuibacteriota bacterium]|nr:MAG: hypothetical protein DME08_18475 [Candidatus Rokubacteria bacterium]
MKIVLTVVVAVAVVMAGDIGFAPAQGQKVVSEDDETKPAPAVRKAEKLILQDDVKLLVGAVSSGATMAIMDVTKKHKTVHWNSVSCAEFMRTTKFHKYYFSNQPDSRMQSNGLAKYIVDKMGHKVYIFYTDYAMGQSDGRQFKTALEKLGGEHLVGGHRHQKFKKRWNLDANIAAGAYDAVLFWAAAVEKAKSFDPDKVAEAHEGMCLDNTHIGRQCIRKDDHQVVMDMHLYQVKGGKNVPIARITGSDSIGEPMVGKDPVAGFTWEIKKKN